MPTPRPSRPDWPVELLRIVGREEAEKLSSMSWDSIVRHHRDKIIKLSPRRIGMRVGDALQIAEDRVGKR